MAEGEETTVSRNDWRLWLLVGVGVDVNDVAGDPAVALLADRGLLPVSVRDAFGVVKDAGLRRPGTGTVSVEDKLSGEGKSGKAVGAPDAMPFRLGAALAKPDVPGGVGMDTGMLPYGLAGAGTRVGVGPGTVVPLPERW